MSTLYENTNNGIYKNDEVANHKKAVAHNVKIPSKNKLWSKLDKGNPRRRTYTKAGVFSIAASAILAFLSASNLIEQSIDNLPLWWLPLFVTALFLFILSEIFKYQNRFPEAEYKDFLDGVTKFFNSSVILEGDARAIIFIYEKKKKAFFTLCCTNGHGAAKNYRSEELSKEHVWFQSFQHGDPAFGDVPKERRSERNILAVFSVPISNKRGEIVGVLVVDAKKSYHECCFLSGIDDDAEKKKLLASFGESLQAYANNITSTIG